MRHCFIALAILAAASAALAFEDTANTGEQARISMGGGGRRATSQADSDLAKQISELRREVDQFRREYQQLRIALLERDLQHAMAERLSIQTERTLAQQEVSELQEQLGHPLDTESYANLSASSSAAEARISALLEAKRKRSAVRHR